VLRSRRKARQPFSVRILDSVFRDLDVAGWGDRLLLRCLDHAQRHALCVALGSQLPPSLDGQHHIGRLTLSDGQQRWPSAQIRPARDSEHAVTGLPP
jgi:hypothetical protein